MREVLEEMSEFGYAKTKVEKLVSSHDHYKLNPVESCLYHSKCYTCSHFDYPFSGLLATTDQFLNRETMRVIAKDSHLVQK